MVRKVDESIDLIVSGCSELARKEYKRRHDELKKEYIGGLLESVILKLEVNGMNRIQKVF